MHINHNLYRYTEQALRDYPDECRRLKLLEEYLCAPAGPGEYVSGGESIPEQERILERKFKSDEWMGLTHKTAIVREFLCAITPQDRVFVQLRYFEGLSWSQVGDTLHVSESTCRRRWAPRLIRRASYILFGELAK